jgi:SpoVK/Ycf46/Vps4 family AAA+-type ATPase
LETGKRLMRDILRSSRDRAAGIGVLFLGAGPDEQAMAAQGIHREMGAELHRVDLAAVVSQYIGETEKNLSRILKESESSGAFLFFDEADALFGKRTEVMDSHDRYANIEINYLLQLFEAHPGA